MEDLANLLGSLATPPLQKIGRAIDGEGIGALRAEIERVISDEARWSKNASIAVQQRCLAVRVGHNGLLDVGTALEAFLIYSSQLAEHLGKARTMCRNMSRHCHVREQRSNG